MADLENRVVELERQLAELKEIKAAKNDDSEKSDVSRTRRTLATLILAGSGLVLVYWVARSLYIVLYGDMQNLGTMDKISTVLGVALVVVGGIQCAGLVLVWALDTVSSPSKRKRD